MPATDINYREFPDSIHARELQRSALDLRFAAPLEAEYTQAHLRRVRLRVRVWSSLVLLVRILSCGAQVRHTGVWSAAALFHIAAILPCSFAILWLAWSRHFERLYMRVAPVLLPVFYALVAVTVASGLAAGQFQEFAGFAVALVAINFFTGLKAREALITAAILLLTFAVAGAVELTLPVLFKSMVVLVITSIIGAIVHRDVEKSYRRGFLEAALIGDLLTRDSLSGLMNRRAFDEHLARVWQQAMREHRTIGLYMIDVDHFKRYNDVFGHQAGDEALRTIARLIQQYARRPMDLAARYGGEEFCVILYDLAPGQAEELAECMRQSVAADVSCRLTVSIGVGLISPTLGRTAQGALQLADEALYEAKRGGRNRVVMKGAEAYGLLSTGKFQMMPLLHAARS